MQFFEKKTCQLSCVTAMLLLTSCSAFWPTGYNQLTQNVPLLKSQYETQSMFTFGGNHLEEQVSFSPLNHVGLMGNFYRRSGDEVSTTYETGIGYYKIFKDSFEIEAYGIYTNSYNRAAFTEDIDRNLIKHDFKTNYEGSSLQLDLGQHYKKAKLSVCFRYSSFNYNDFYYHRKDYGTDTTYYLSSRYQSFITVAPTFKVGGKHVRYYAQIAYHLNLNSGTINTQSPPFYSGITFTNGIEIYLDFGKKK